MKHWYFLVVLAAVILFSTHVAEAHEDSQPIVKPGWTLVLDDEFNGTSLDTSKWDTCYPWWDPNNCQIEDNSELEYYLPGNAYLDGAGHLELKAEKRNIGGRDYASGMIDSFDSFSFQYGYVEARVKLPAGPGFWPAFWMLPVNDGPWPDDEIDIMENLGYDPTTAYFSYHWPSSGTTLMSQYHYSGPDLSTDWHTFAVDWEPDAITWYLDGVERARYTDAANITSKPMFVILTYAIGGINTWPGPPNSTTPFPSYYQVDYVRVWQKATSLYMPFVMKGGVPNSSVSKVSVSPYLSCHRMRMIPR